MASKKELVRELEAKMEEFYQKSQWADSKAEAHEELAVGKKGSARTRHLKQQARFEGEALAWNQAAWEIKGLLKGLGN